VKTTLLVSLAWMIFNMIPPYLLMHYQFVGRGTTLKIACKCAPAASSC
jgi:endoglucanase